MLHALNAPPSVVAIDTNNTYTSVQHGMLCNLSLQLCASQVQINNGNVLGEVAINTSTHAWPFTKF